MDDQRRGDAEDDFEEPEELEELDESALPDGAAPAPPERRESPILLEEWARSVVASYAQIPEPLAILDESLFFAYRNPLFEVLLAGIRVAQNPSLAATLGQQLDLDQSRAMVLALADPMQGYSWKGIFELKRRDTSSLILKAHIFPLWPGAGRKLSPAAYSIYLDDITEENKRFLRDYLDSMLRASLKKDQDTGNHVRRVNLYASRIAESLRGDARWPQVDRDFVEEIGFLAAMHDVGKIGTPDDILNKEGPLNEDEWRIMKEHTVNGAFILSSYPNRMAKEIALSHHEWWNGSGYPYNFEQTMIPLSARIVTVADVYDALRMKRSYKPAYSHELAMQKMRHEAGVHFDPDLLGILLQVHEDFARIFTENAD